MQTISYLLLLFFLIILSALFSAAETALMSTHMVKVKALLKKNRPGSVILYKLKQKPHNLIITILVGNNLVNIFATAIATALFIQVFGLAGMAYSAIVMTIVILTFGEILPKLLAVQHHEDISLVLAAPIYYLSIVFFPIIWLFTQLSNLINKVFKTKKKQTISEEELRIILTLGKEEGIISKEVARIMHKVLDFEDTKVTKIMTPFEKVHLIDGQLKIDSAIDFIVRKSHSRYPVYIEEEDNIIGIVDVDDVLKAIKDKKADSLIKDITRTVEFVLPDKEIGDLLYEFEDKSVLMAIVVDKKGDVLGLVTIEDILEEIVGNIFDKSNRKIRR
ncbi:MAG TPA: hemolysin family protein [archaeon]|nr:hemolysin family protein [archaeon]